MKQSQDIHDLINFLLDVHRDKPVLCVQAREFTWCLYL